MSGPLAVCQEDHSARRRNEPLITHDVFGVGGNSVEMPSVYNNAQRSVQLVFTTRPN